MGQTFADNFVREVQDKPAPIAQSEKDNPDGTLHFNDIDDIAGNCNSKDHDPGDAFTAGDTIHEADGTWYFSDGSKAGLRNQNGKWDAWVMKF